MGKLENGGVGRRGFIKGAAAGAATQGLTRGQGVRLPAESVLTFRLEAPIRVREMR